MNRLYWKEKYDHSNRIGNVTMLLLFAFCITFARPEMVTLNETLLGAYIVSAYVHMIYRCRLAYRLTDKEERLFSFIMCVIGILIAPLIAPMFIGDYKGDRI